MTRACCLCAGAHGRAYPLAEAAIDTRSGKALAAGEPVCVRCACLLFDAPRPNPRAAESALERN